MSSREDQDLEAPEPPGAQGEGSTLRGKLKRSLPYTLQFALFHLVLSLVSLLLLVRYLPPEEYGVWALLSALTGLLALVISLGFPQYITRFLSTSEDREDVARRTWSILARRLITTAACSAGLVLAFDLYAPYVELEGYSRHVLFAQVQAFGTIGALYVNRIMSARFMQREVLLVEIPYRVLFVGAIAVGIQLERDLLYFVQVAGFTALLHFLLSAVIFARAYGRPKLHELLEPWRESPEERRYRRTSYVAEYGATLLNTEADRYILALVATNVQVAVYAVATTVVTRLQRMLPMLLFRPLMEVTFFAHYAQTGRNEELDRMFRFLFKTNAVFSFYFVALFFPLGGEVLEAVFQEAYRAAYWPILIFLTAIPLLQMPVGMVLKALNQVHLLAYAQLVVIINVILGLALASSYGALGMAAATAGSVILKNVILYFAAVRTTRLHIPWAGVSRLAVAACAAAAITLPLVERIPLIAAALITSAAYGVAVRLLGPFDATERELVRKMLPDRAARLVRWLLGGPRIAAG